MKILIAAAAMLAALTSYPATVPEAAAPIVYAVGATVAEVDTAAQRITAEDTRGHLWDFYGTGYRAGAPLVLVMSDNGTPEEVTDDAIIIALEME